MKKLITVIGLGLLSTLFALPAAAVPALQLDIVGGTYDGSDETIVTQSNSFDLVAYGLNGSVSTTEDYFISIALTPQTGATAPADIGSFMFAGDTYDIDSPEFQYGAPPLDVVANNLDLAGHGIFPTFYIEIAFTFDTLLTRDSVNTQDTTGSDPTASPGSDLFYQLFSVDISNLLPEFELHFDLYNTKIKNFKSGDVIAVDDFAPFSHDAATVPEPGPLVLLGLGLIALFVTRSKLQTKKI